MSAVAEKVKETGLICTAESVRSILVGRKTQTRRVIMPQPFHAGKGEDCECLTDGHCHFCEPKCRYGQPGDRLWVKENLYIAPPRFSSPAEATHRDNAGRPRLVSYSEAMDGDSVRCANDYGVKETPSIFMPKWACRIWLEVTNIRVERVQEISYADCIAEGIVDVARAAKRSKRPGEHPIEQFRTRWESINLHRGFGWDLNPWVWVIEFKKLEGK